MAYVNLHYKDYCKLRDMMLDVDASDIPEDRLDAGEIETFDKIQIIIARMEQKRKEEDATGVRQPRMIRSQFVNNRVNKMRQDFITKFPPHIEAAL